jgi:large subunit ribosomal protein L4
MYKGALRSIFSELIRQERLVIVDEFKVDEPKTKALLKKLIDMKIEGEVLIISDAVENNLYLSARNLPHVEIRDTVASAMDPVALVRAVNVIVTEAAIKEIEGLLR